MPPPPRLTVTLLFIMSLLCPVTSYSTGAGPEGCDDLTPRHAPSQVPGPSPYKIVVKQDRVTPGGLVEVTLKGPVALKGFLIQARYVGTNPGDANSIVGTWEELPNKTTFRECDYPSSSVTHSIRLTVREVRLTWRAPAVLTRDVVFRATVVQSFTAYWVAISSPVVKFGCNVGDGWANNACQPCELNMYKSTVDTGACTSCPQNTVTDGTGTTSKKDCHDRPGNLRWRCWGPNPSSSGFPLTSNGPLSFIDNQDGIASQGGYMKQLEYNAGVAGVPVTFMFFVRLGATYRFRLLTQVTHTARTLGWNKVSLNSHFLPVGTRVGFEVSTGQVVPIPYATGQAGNPGAVYHSHTGYTADPSGFFAFTSKLANRRYQFRLCQAIPIPEPLQEACYGHGVPSIAGQQVQKGPFSVIDMAGASQLPSGKITRVQWRVFRTDYAIFQVWRPVDLDEKTLRLVHNHELRPRAVQEVLEEVELSLYVQDGDYFGFTYILDADVPIRYTTQSTRGGQPYRALECDGCSAKTEVGSEVTFERLVSKQFRIRVCILVLDSPSPQPTPDHGASEDDKTMTSDEELMRVIIIVALAFLGALVFTGVFVALVFWCAHCIFKKDKSAAYSDQEDNPTIYTDQGQEDNSAFYTEQGQDANPMLYTDQGHEDNPSVYIGQGNKPDYHEHEENEEDDIPPSYSDQENNPEY